MSRFSRRPIGAVPGADEAFDEPAAFKWFISRDRRAARESLRPSGALHVNGHVARCTTTRNDLLLAAKRVAAGFYPLLQRRKQTSGRGRVIRVSDQVVGFPGILCQVKQLLPTAVGVIQ
jgi:hypothetical protein